MAVVCARGAQPRRRAITRVRRTGGSYGLCYIPAFRMDAKRLYIETVGCQMNVLDSELVVGHLRRQGYSLTQVRDDADVVLFNTCSIREHAEEKIYSALGTLR